MGLEWALKNLSTDLISNCQDFPWQILLQNITPEMFKKSWKKLEVKMAGFEEGQSGFEGKTCLLEYWQEDLCELGL